MKFELLKKQTHKLILRNYFFACCVLLFPFLGFSQKKEVSLEESDFNSIIQYSASDSIYADFQKKILYLFGDAKLNYDETLLSAAYMEVDLNKKEVYTTYSTDSFGNKIGIPVFVENGDTITSAAIRYNFETKKGYIQDVMIKQDEFYLSMGVAKVQSNKDIHFTNGKFTTCNLADPHFHFRLSRAILVPDKRIITGPINLWILGIPTPLALPFAIIPLKKREEKLNGFILPQFSVLSPYGMGMQDLGYYFPINDRFQTTVYGTLFSRGSFGIRNSSEYRKLYKYSGNFELGYTRFRFGWPDSSATNTGVLRWSHTQDPKANPNWNFGASVNFNTNSTNKQTFQVQNQEFFNNTLNSDIRLGKRFGSKPISADLKMSMRQNSQSSRIVLTAPTFNFQTTSRIFPFKNKNKLVGFSYSNEIQNRSSFGDTLLKQKEYAQIAQQFMNGASHKINVQGTFSLLRGTVRLTPQVNYGQIYNFQSISKTVNTLSNQLEIDSLKTGGFSHDFSSSATISTTLFSYYRFIGKRKTILRHVATPTVAFTFNPSIQKGKNSILDTNGNVINYSIYEQSIYAQSFSNSSGRINFGLNNTFELKQKNDKDTTTGFKKTRIIDNLFFSTDYDIFKDSMNWGDLSFRMVINPNEFINIAINGAHSFYSWNNLSGEELSSYALETGQGLGRIKNGSVSTGLNFTSKKNRKRLSALNTTMEPSWNPIYQQWLLSPNQLVYFEIPWKISVEHILAFNLNTNPINYLNNRYTLNNTLRASADLNITENWKIQGTVLYDAVVKKISNLNLNLYRNIHCWNVAFTWTPIGTNKSFLISLRGNASMLQNANINLRRPPLVF